MRKNYLFFALCALFLFIITPHAYATDYTIEPTSAVKSNTLPLFRTDQSLLNSITQQIYLPSEFSPSGATAGNITAVTFYYAAKDGNTVDALSRNIEIWLMETDVESYTLDHVGYVWKSKFLCNGSNKAGTKVYDGVLNTEGAITSSSGDKTVTLTFDSPFAWDGTSNIVLTLFDKSTTTIGSNAKNYLKFYITQTSKARFVHHKIIDGASDNISTWINNINAYGDEYSSASDSAGWASKRVYVPKTTFSITPAAVAIPVPENLRTTSISTNSARLLWDAVDGATGYNVQWGTNSASLDHSASNVANTYLDIDELVDGTTYYFAVQTIKGEKTSSYSDAADFETTAITITYKGIVFKKWNSTTSLPSEEGNYYLNGDVGLVDDVTISEDIKLCLNGHDVYTEANNITVENEGVLTLYDNMETGLIYGNHVATYGDYGLISVQSGGTLIIGEGKILNRYGTYVDPDDPSKSDDPMLSYAIFVNIGGTFKLSGNPSIIAVTADIYLQNNTKITIESGKPLTNQSAYGVDAVGQTITSGWANMGDVDPNVHFVSKKSTHKGITLNGGEVKFVQLSDLDVSLNESSADNESKLTAELNNNVSLAITRSSLTNAQYNTICLPYAMSDAEMQLRFGVGYDLQEFVSSSLDGDELSLVFSPATSLVAGKPYLLKPSINAPALSYLSVNIAADSPADQTSDEFISFHGTFAPTPLEGGNKKILFLGADDELFWPAADGNIKGFRAYFEVKGAAQQAVRARIVKGEEADQAIDQTSQEPIANSQKLIKDGQLLIERNGKIYNAQGQVIK